MGTIYREGVNFKIRSGDVLRLEDGRRVRVTKATQYMDLALIHFEEIIPWWERLFFWSNKDAK